MAEKDAKRSWVMVNRAPVLTLWAAVVTEVLGFGHDEALSLGRAVAGLNASSKGVPWGSSSRPPWGEGDGEGNVVQFTHFIFPFSLSSSPLKTPPNKPKILC